MLHSPLPVGLLFSLELGLVFIYLLINRYSLANLQDPSLDDARRVDYLVRLNVGKGTVTLHQIKDFICTKLENLKNSFVKQVNVFVQFSYFVVVSRSRMIICARRLQSEM